MKKILHICLSEGWGGLEMAVLRWNKILEEKGHQNWNICTPGSPLADALKEQEASLFEWDSAHYIAPDFTWKLRQLVHKEKFDAVILQNLRDLWIVSPALIGRPRTQLIGFTQMLIGVKKTDFLHRWVYSRLDHLLTLTDWQQKALRPYLPVPPGKYKTVPNFVDTKKFSPKNRSPEFRYQMGFSEEDFVIGLIGRIDEQKGQRELIEAFSRVAPRYKQIQLLIVGEPTQGEAKQEAYFHSLKELVDGIKEKSRIHFLGFQKNPEKLMANIDLFVLASHEETFGYVVVEAMASGTAILGTQAGGVPEILQQGQCGFLCQPKNATDLAKQLEFILENPSLRAEKMDEALLRAREFYDRHQVYESLIRLL